MRRLSLVVLISITALFYGCIIPVSPPSPIVVVEVGKTQNFYIQVIQQIAEPQWFVDKNHMSEYDGHLSFSYEPEPGDEDSWHVIRVAEIREEGGTTSMTYWEWYVYVPEE